jgi:Bifunctional DNA primase/polymerase, N-terminal
MVSTWGTGRAVPDTTLLAFDPGAYISGYRQLAALRVGFYPVYRDKSPAVQGKLNRVATNDPIKIRFWAECCHHRSFAARLLRDCRGFVIDTESPWKHPDRPGPDGEMFLGSLLEDSDTTLPRCPIVQTASGGFHRYLLVPKGFPIRPRVALWPGIDILTAGSSVILPGSRTEAGEYRAVRSFEESPIPEAPRAFIKLIRRAQEDGRCPDRTRATVGTYIDETDTSEVAPRQWWLLFRNRVFRSFWERRGKAGDATDSAYEYHLAKACFCCGLNYRQAESVILTWRRKHSLTRDLRQLRNAIIPKAWCEVEPWVERWHAERDAAEQLKKAAKTANIILAYIRNAGRPQTPSAISAALPIPRERAKKAMQRMAEDGRLVRTSQGYEIVATVGTF